MTEIRQPRSLGQATELLQLFAELEGEVARIEAKRARLIARANAAADALLAPVVAERDLAAEKVEPWFDKAKDELLGGKRKSIALGGCEIGHRKGKDTLAHDFDSDDLAVDALKLSRFRKHTLKEKWSLDRAATLKLLEVGGRTAAAIREIGFRIVPGADAFFVRRAEQAGTIGG